LGVPGEGTLENVEPCTQITGIAGGFARAEERYQNRLSLRHLFLQGLEAYLGAFRFPANQEFGGKAAILTKVQLFLQKLQKKLSVPKIYAASV
jgi:hypothetical protein